MMNRSSPLVRSFRRIRKLQATTRPHLLPHLQNLRLALPSGPMASGLVHRRRLPSSLKLPYIGELWSALSVFLYVHFQLSTFMKLIAFASFRYPSGCTVLATPYQNPYVSIPTGPPDCMTAERTFVYCVRGGLSIIPRTSTTRDVATKRYARNALFKSSDPNRRPLIWFPNRRLVLTAYRSTLGWCTPHPLGGPALVATVRCVSPPSPWTSVSEPLTLCLSDASVMAGFSKGGIPLVGSRGWAATSP